MRDPQALAAAASEALATRALGRSLTWVAQTGSTNADLKARAADAPHGAVLIADAQTAGRGRLGRRWEAPPGEGLLLSALLKPRIPAERAALVGFCAALALADALEEAGAVPGLKWPNDVWVGAAKIAGILSEAGLTGAQLGWVVLGIGVNLNQGAGSFPAALGQPATSLRLVTGAPVDRARFAARLLGHLEPWLDRWEGGDTPGILAAWRARSITLGRRVSYDGGRAQGPIAGEAVDLADDGALILRREGGSLHRITAGDVRLEG